MAFYEVVLNWISVAGEFKTVLHYETDAVHGTDMEAMVDLVAVAWSTNLQARTAPAQQFQSVTVREDSPGAVGVEYPVPLGPLPGTNGDNDFGGQLAVMVRKRNISGNRPAQGRMYIPGITAGGLTENSTWQNDVVAACEAFAEDIRDFQAPLAGPLWVMQIKASDPSKPNTVPYASVDLVEGANQLVTLDRRKRGVGI